MRGLKGKSAIVTGAGSGIGKAIAQRLAAEGMLVGVFDINAAGADESVSAIKAAGGTAIAVQCDITDYAAVTSAVAAFEAAAAQPVDVLVNNAGWDTPMPFLKTDPAFWQKVTSINWFGPLHMTHAVGQGMASRKSGPHHQYRVGRGPRRLHWRGRVLRLQGCHDCFLQGIGTRAGPRQRHDQHDLPRTDRHAGDERFCRNRRTGPEDP